MICPCPVCDESRTMLGNQNIEPDLKDSLIKWLHFHDELYTRIAKRRQL